MAGRGRPVREPTQEERLKVRVLTEAGASKRAVAIAVGRSIPNLRKYFAAEMECKLIPAPEPAPFTITDEMRQDVALMAACNEPHTNIAKAIGISEADLEQIFGEDLDIFIARYRLKILRQMDKLATNGNLTATKQIAALMAPVESGASPYRGKKLAAKAGAQEAIAAGSIFAPRGAPRLAAINGQPVNK